PLKSTCHSEGEARKNPADSLKSWIASHSLAMTKCDYSEQVRAEDESVTYPFKASTVSEESHNKKRFFGRKLPQNDVILIPAPCGRGSKGVGVTLDKIRSSGSIQYDENTLSHCERVEFQLEPVRKLEIRERVKKVAFTLAETLITLGIIGIVAALTIPGLLTKCQQTVIKNQFKKQYSVIQQAFKMVEHDLDYTPNCYYWVQNPYGNAECVSRDEDGNCKKYELADGSSLPSDYNGRFSDCDTVKAMMKQKLKVATICQNKAYEKGCIPAYKGNDTVYRDSNSNKDDLTDFDVNKATSGCAAWREAALRNQREAWVLQDGTIILFYSGFQLFAIDVNGNRGPNKWGYDLFQFLSSGDGSTSIKLLGGACVYPEKGGMSTNMMLKTLFSK
ncbi:MAG: type II secretion system GspH family protein, partial [Muribaculaceae bacterium]|nr:type II secretion system GspH family protein [Muribaculaceae bacterium]